MNIVDANFQLSMNFLFFYHSLAVLRMKKSWIDVCFQWFPFYIQFFKAKVGRKDGLKGADEIVSAANVINETTRETQWTDTQRRG